MTARNREVDTLERWYGDASVGGCVVTGAAGVGKTRLAEERLRQAGETGRPVARVIGHPATESIPLGAIAHLLPAEIAEIQFGPDGRAALFHAARAALVERAEGQRLLLVIDDVDHLDQTSLALLLPLVLHGTVFLLATLRSGRPLPGPVAALVKDQHLERLELSPLTGDQTQTLLERVLDGPLDEASLQRLQILSDGNLQLLRELVRQSLEQGALESSGGAWRLDGPLDGGMLEDLVQNRLSTLDEDELQALDLVAVAGSIGLGDLEALCGTDTLEQLDRLELLAVAPSGNRTEIRLAHPLYHEALLGRMSILRRRSLQRALADQIESHDGRRREDVIRLARWRLDAGGGRLDSAHLMRAGRLALAARDHELALRFARAATEAGAWAVPEIVEARVLAGQVTSALAAVDEAWWRDDLGDDQIEYLARRGADLRFNALSDLDGALALNESGRTRLSDPAYQASLNAHRAALLATAAIPSAALEHADLSQVQAPDATRVTIEVAIARSVAYTCRGRFDLAVHWARTGAEAQRSLPAWESSPGMATHLINEAHALAYAGHYGEARALMDRARERAATAGARGAALWFELVLAEIDRDTGRGSEALARFSRVAHDLAGVGQAAALVWARVGVAQSLLLLGRSDEAAQALESADAAGYSPVATSAATRDRARAWLLAARGDLAGARRLLSRLADEMAQSEVYAMEAPLRHDLARFGDPGPQVPRLGELATMVDGPLTGAFLDHARGLANDDPGELEAALTRFEALDVAVLGAEAAAELARHHQRSGDLRSAAAARRRMGDLLERCGGAATPCLILSVAAEPLTAREREVALLAATGQRAQAIADQLYVSKRTIDTHLDRVYRKLGVAGRDELRQVLASSN